jgi:predicted transposase/invertase (TIGR01784 family)
MSYDSTLKYLIEEYPQAIVEWLLGANISETPEILKTELNLEPIRVDGLFFLKTSSKIIHLEFQTIPQSKPPLPLRMLDYWVRLYRQYNIEIEQIVIFLKPTISEDVFINEFRATNTFHRYRVIRIWECEPEPLLATTELLPLAVLAKADNSSIILEQVAAKVNIIEDRRQKINISACVQLLAGIKFDTDIINAYFWEDIMQESVVYQKIVREGLEQGRRLEVKLILRIIQRHLGKIGTEIQNQIADLSFTQLEDLGEALLDFKTETDLRNWLSENCE